MTLLTSITCEQPAQIEVAGYTFVTTGMFRNDRLALEPTWTDLPRQLGPALAELRRQLADAGY